MMYFALVETTFGQVTIIHHEEGVIGIFLPQAKQEAIQSIKTQFPDAKNASSDNIDSLMGMLIDYFDGKKVKFPLDVLDMSECYPFQIEVLNAEWSIPYGKVAFYGGVARKIGSSAYRAVGTALARNPFPIIIPCHRTIRSDRTLGGFQGGLEMKRKILELEGVEFDGRGRVKEEFVDLYLDPSYDYLTSPSYIDSFNGTF